MDTSEAFKIIEYLRWCEFPNPVESTIARISWFMGWIFGEHLRTKSNPRSWNWVETSTTRPAIEKPRFYPQKHRKKADFRRFSLKIITLPPIFWHSTYSRAKFSDFRLRWRYKPHHSAIPDQIQPANRNPYTQLPENRVRTIFHAVDFSNSLCYSVEPMYSYWSDSSAKFRTFSIDHTPLMALPSGFLSLFGTFVNVSGCTEPIPADQSSPEPPTWPQ